MDTPHSSAPRNTHQIVVGFVIGAIGVMLLADRLFDRHFAPIHSWWPLVLIVMGAARLGNPNVDRAGRPRGLRSAAWLMMVGLWGLATEGRWLGLGFGTSWPLLVIGAGVLMVWRSVDHTGRPPAEKGR